MEKKISVVIPTYRRTALLRKCLAALALQNFNSEDFEIVVVSDGPDPKTAAVLEELRPLLPAIHFVSLAEKKGPAAARNAGWRAANGLLIAFTDDDCLPAPSWLTAAWQQYEQLSRPELIVFTGKVVVPVPAEPTDFELNTSHLQTADFVTANCFCTKASLLLVGGFDERFTAAWREDSDLEFRLLENNIPIIRKINAVVVHPVRKVEWGISIREQKKNMFNALLYKKFPSLFRKRIKPYPSWNYYSTLLGFIFLIAGLIYKSPLLTISGTVIYLGFTIAFIHKRLTRTSRSVKHVLEMIATSMIIPFCSVYWTLYGSFKYRVLYY